MSVSHSIRIPRRSETRRSPRFGRLLFGPLCLLLEGAVVVGAALFAWSAWRLLAIGQPTSLEIHLRFALGAAIIVAFLSVVRDEHRLGYYLSAENQPWSTARTWNTAIFILFVTAFLTRQAEELSRGVMILFYVCGFVALWWARSFTTRTIQAASKLRHVLGQRILVVGSEGGIGDFLRRHQPWNLGLEVVGTVAVTPLSNGPGLTAELSRAVDLAREIGPDDVYLAVPWSETATIDRCVEAFLQTPIAIHLAPERIFDRFDQVSIGRVGPMSSLELTRPTPVLAGTVKRTADIVLSVLGLVLLVPVFAAIGLLIKLDSPGPVFFFQTRYGFNQRPFRIFKFRTMTTFQDGGEVPQATKGDHRVTTIGRLLRRTNIDELPQLANVALGHMSLVGPRPHAVPHNRAYERRIALYARRHNVKPGITGWAQVNGLRGETDTDDKMRRRVEYDLFYIDNWSLLFDLRIMLKTVFSGAGYRNAY